MGFYASRCDILSLMMLSICIFLNKADITKIPEVSSALFHPRKSNPILPTLERLTPWGMDVEQHLKWEVLLSLLLRTTRCVCKFEEQKPDFLPHVTSFKLFLSCSSCITSVVEARPGEKRKGRFVQNRCLLALASEGAMRELGRPNTVFLFALCCFH